MHKLSRFARTLGVAALAAAMAVGPNVVRPAAAAEPFVFNYITVSTGPLASYGLDPTAGIEIAGKDINAHGGIEGRPVQLHGLDSQSDIAQSVALARAQCDGGAILVIGPVLSTQAASVFPAINTMDCPIFAPSPAATGLTTKSRPWTFVGATPAAVITPEGIKVLMRVVKPKSAVVVVDTSDPSDLDQANRSRDTFTGAGVKVSDTLTAAVGQLDFTALSTRIQSEKPDVILVSTSAGSAVGLMRQLRKDGVKTPLCFTQASYTPELQGAPKELLEGNYVYSQLWPGNPDARVKAFVKEYQAMRGNDHPTQLATQWYDTLYMAKAAFESCKVTGDKAKLTAERTCVRNWLQNMKDFKGITGSFTMTPDGYPVLPVNLLRFQNGDLVLAGHG